MIPKASDLGSDKLVHKYADVFNPPGLTNFWGTLQADVDITGIMGLNFPPFTTGHTLTCGIYLNNRFFPSLGLPVTFTWYPDRIVRETEYDGISITTTTVMPEKKKAAVMKISFHNKCGDEKEINFRLGYQGNVSKYIKPWQFPHPPVDENNNTIVDENRKAILFESSDKNAFNLQGSFPIADSINKFGPSYTLKLNAGDEESIYYFNIIGSDYDETIYDYDYLVSIRESILDETRNLWNDELKAVFTPENERYSGFMPTLFTDDKDILKLYHTGILGTIYFKRDNPYSVYGRAYDTLMPRYWQTVTFIWDYYLSSLVHSLLDPAVQKKYLNVWMAEDVHTHFGTDYLSGGTVGPWYSVNDFAMLTLSSDYLRWSGDFNFTDEKINYKPTNNEIDVFTLLTKFAKNWKNFQSSSGLADYGGINNLLECVSTYIHEVAALNASNIYNSRFMSELASYKNDKTLSDELNSNASFILEKIQSLYAKGKGFWNTRFPDGNLVEVRHCYDFITILNTIPDDLSETQKTEITNFFINELQTENWMRANSPEDNNAIFSARPDHQWNGAYPAWPPMAVTGLYKIGQSRLAFDWLKGLAKSANQGPFGQAHFTDEAYEKESGGARKTPYTQPYLTDWMCSSNGSWVNIIIESIFGVKATLFNGISAAPQFEGFDPKSELQNLKYQDKMYNVTSKGIVQTK